MTTCGFGLRVEGGPGLGAIEPAPYGTLRWIEAGHLDLPRLDHSREGDNWRLQYGPDRYWVSMLDGADFVVHVPDAGEARVEVRLAGWSAEKASLFFLMGLLPMALPRFQLGVLHGSAHSPDGRSACLVVGESGTGKSTMLARSLDRGSIFLADDACAIDRRGGLWPAPPVWASRDRSGDHPDDYIGKGVSVVTDRIPGPVEIGGVVELRPDEGSALHVERLSGRDRMITVLRNQRSSWLFTDHGAHDLRITVATAVATAPIAAVYFDHAVHDAEAVGDAIDAWFHGMSRRPLGAVALPVN